MTIAVFNPEHDLCLAKGRAHYVPPRSAVAFARRDAQAVMGTLYPGAHCCSVYDLPPLSAPRSPLSTIHSSLSITAWGWDAVVRHELLKRGAPAALLPSEADILRWRDLQHRATILPLQPDCHAVRSEGEMQALLRQREHWVMKAPWSGAGRGLRWVHGALSDIDRAWLVKTVAAQRCVIAEPRRDVVADFALEYLAEGGDLRFLGYSLFTTGSGVYRDNLPLSDAEIEHHIATLAAPEGSQLSAKRSQVESWLHQAVLPHYRGPLGIDLMADRAGQIHIAEMNLRHTMGMVAIRKHNAQATSKTLQPL